MIFASITLFLLFLFTTIHAEAKQKPPNRETEIHTHNARFTSRLFATLLFLNCYFASWRAQEARRRNEGYKDQHRQRASLVSTDGAKVWETFVPDEFLRVGGKLEKEKEKEVHFFTPFWVLWRKFGES